MKKLYIAGNWKMNKNEQETAEYFTQLLLVQDQVQDSIEQIICPPFLYLHSSKKLTQISKIIIGAQNVSDRENGAFTGEISAQMLKDMGITHCIIGHSERRQYFHESNELIGKKYIILKKYGIIPIICIGETLEQRESGHTNNVLREQLEGIFRDKVIQEDEQLLIAYEPVWAIGTGKTATPDMAQEVHSLIRNWLIINYNHSTAERIPLLYGGSVKPDNIQELMNQDDIDGALIGGASLEITSYIKMIELAGEIKKC